MVRPGETRKVTLTPKPGVRFLGVAVLFHDIDRAQWRAIAPIAASGTTRLVLAVGSNKAALERHDLVQPRRLAGRNVPARAALPAAGPLARSAGARTARPSLRPHPLGPDGMRDRPRPAGHRPVRAGQRQRRVRGRHAVRPARRDRPAGAARPAGERRATSSSIWRCRCARPASVEVADNGSSEGRYEQRRFEAYDTHSGSPQPAELQVGRLRLRYMLETDERAGYLCIGLARVAEVGADRRVILDDQWIPPALVCSAAPPLAGLIAELAGMLNQRGEALAARLTAPGSARRRARSRTSCCCNRSTAAQKLLAHWASDGNVHPDRSLRRAGADGRRVRDLHRDDAPAHRTIRRIGTTTCSAASRRSSPICAARCRRCSSRPPSRSRCTKRAYGVRVGPIIDRSILRASSFVLTVQADVPTETVAAAVPLAGQDRRGRAHPRAGQRRAAGHRGAAVAGRAAATAVLRRRDLFRAGPQLSPHWQQMQTSGGFAIHVSGDFPNLQSGTVGDPRLTTADGRRYERQSLRRT